MKVLIAISAALLGVALTMMTSVKAAPSSLSTYYYEIGVTEVSKKLVAYADAYMQEAANAKSPEDATKFTLAAFLMEAIDATNSQIVGAAVRDVEEARGKWGRTDVEKIFNAHAAAKADIASKLEGLVKLGSELRSSTIMKDAKEVMDDLRYLSTRMTKLH